MRHSFRIVLALALLASGACTSPPPPTGTGAGFVLPAAADGARLPEFIADSTWWRLVTTLSEPGGYFRSENFVSNELGLQRVVHRLRATTPTGGVYVGVGPEQNFTYIAALEPRVAFIVDIRRQNLLQHLWYKAVFELSPTRTAFLSRLFARPLRESDADVSADSLVWLLERTPRDSALFRRTHAEVVAHLTRTRALPLDSADLRTLRYVDSVFYLSGPALNYSSTLGDGGFRLSRRMPTFADMARATDSTGRNLGFLADEGAYTRVRERQRRNLIIPVVGNFAGPHALQAVGRWLRARDAAVHVFYTSNVEQYLFQQPDDWRRFYANVGDMPVAPDARFIRSVTAGYGAPRGGFLMTQLTSDVTSLVRAAATGDMRGYADVIRRSVPE